jgi:DNA-binding LacI/PurR family transcriptional regulator
VGWAFAVLTGRGRLRRMNETPRSVRPSLRDIAKRLGISHVAVSLALRGSSRVGEKRRAEVRRVAQELGYRPDPMLASLAAYRQGKRPAEIRSSLAWLNLWEEPGMLRGHKEFDCYWVGANEAAERMGYILEEFRWQNGKSGGRLQTILQTRGVRGILLPPHRGGVSLPDFAWGEFSVVRFGASVNQVPAHMVTSDQSHCARLAFEKALEYGYQRVGYVSGAEFERATSGNFRAGFLNAQEELVPRGKQLKPLVVGADVRRQEGEVLAWLRSEKPDAVLSALGIFRSLTQRLGVRVPQDVAVAAMSVLDGNFDTGADQNSEEIGRVAVSTLASLILENQRGLPTYTRRILVEGRWVEGTSMPRREPVAVRVSARKKRVRA